MSPVGIQLRRQKGWRKPEGAVVVSRPSKWGNPHRIGDRWIRTSSDGAGGLVDTPHALTAEQAVETFEADLRAGLLRFTAEDVRRELAGKDLACWCPIGQSCHRDVLLEIANSVAVSPDGGE